ncbi:MAG: DUF3618 domain-containing protein [Actinomycetota bacterium]|nr:DUF3618 domain-containing protein [Actinomycetota bacterium]
MAKRDQSPDDIVRDIEDNREQLALTIDALVYRTSPKTIARRALASVKATFVGPDGSPRVANLAKVGGAVVGVVAAVLAVRHVAGGD